MKYEQPTFQTNSNSQAYRDSWERMFGEGVEEEPKVEEALKIWVVFDCHESLGAFTSEQQAQRVVDDNYGAFIIFTTLSLTK